MPAQEREHTAVKQLVVDIHPHIIADDSKKYPVNPIGGKQSTWSVERPATFEELVEEMDRAGVDKAAIVHSSTVYGFDNSYVADSIAAHTDRFAGVFSVDVRAPTAGETIRAWCSLPGMVGLRIFTMGSTLPGQAFPIDDPATYPAWAAAADLGIPVCIQITYGGIPDLRRLMHRFPSVNVILDHFALPPVEKGPPYDSAASLFDLVDESRLYLKLTPLAIANASKGLSTPQAFMKALVGRFGASRIAWGSNFPNDPGTLTELLNECTNALEGLSKDDVDAIMGRTALSLYPTLA